jgi:hypothetical protein
MPRAGAAPFAGGICINSVTWLFDKGVRTYFKAIASFAIASNPTIIRQRHSGANECAVCCGDRLLIEFVTAAGPQITPKNELY